MVNEYKCKICKSIIMISPLDGEHFCPKHKRKRQKELDREKNTPLPPGNSNKLWKIIPIVLTIVAIIIAAKAAGFY